MVDLRIDDDTLVLDVQGTHQLWAFRSSLETALANVRAAHRPDPDEIDRWKGWRIVGTTLPGFLKAGVFQQDGKRMFWDVRDPERAIAIELEGGDFDELVVEVADPDAALARLREALASRDA